MAIRPVLEAKSERVGCLASIIFKPADGCADNQVAAPGMSGAVQSAGPIRRVETKRENCGYREKPQGSDIPGADLFGAGLFFQARCIKVIV